MPLSDHVSIVLTKDTVGIALAGFGVPLILSAQASWTERVRFYSDLPSVADDFALTTSPEYLAAQALFSQTPKPKQIAIGRAANKPTQKYQINISTVAANNHYLLNVAGQGVTATAIDVLTTAADLTVTAVTNGADSLTVVAHGMATGDGPYRVSNSGGGLPAGLAVDTNYWVIKLTADTFSLAATKVDALALTPVNLTSDGTGTQTIRRVQNDVICAQLVQALNAVTGANYTAAQITGAAETDYIEVTGNAAGNWFSLEVVRPQDMAIKQTHADPGSGVAVDLAACALESDAWYALVTLYNSSAYVTGAAGWIETQTKVYIPDVNETEAITTAIGSANDTLKALHTSARTRTMGAYHPSPAAMFAAAWMGRCLPEAPGSETWNDKTLSGPAVVTLTTTQRNNLLARHANSYQLVAQLNKTFTGQSADGEFFDTIRDLDSFVDDAGKSVYAVISGAGKVAFDDAGIARVEGALRAAVKRAIKAGIVADGTDTYEVPLAADVNPSDRANRILSGLKFAFRLAGAIQDVLITGVVTA